MKRFAIFCLTFLVLLHATFAWGSESETIDPQDDNMKSASVISGYMIKDDIFYTLGDSYFQSCFIGTMSKVTLNEMQEMVFNPARLERLLPNLYITLPQLELDADVVSDIVKFILGITSNLQEKYPDSFLFNAQMMTDLAEAGLGYLVAEPDIWLRPETYTAAMIPMCFYNHENGELVDGMYLLEITTTEDGAFRCALYSDPEHIIDYMVYVTIDSGKSSFQNALAQWYLVNYPIVKWQNFVIGTVRITNAVSYVGDEDNLNARVVARVQQGEELPVLFTTENGWYLVRCMENVFGYISPMGVEFLPKE